MKLRNKLILSCAALAAVATTAVSTTYAWYTSNTEVTADGLVASSAAGADQLLLISKSGAKGSWGSKITLENTATFNPVSQESNGNYYLFDQDLAAPAGNAVSLNKTTQTTSGNILSFNVYLMSGGDALTVNIQKFLITNVTGMTAGQNGYTGNLALPSKTILAAGGQGGVSGGITGGNDTGTTYTVDLMRALVVDYQTITVTGNAGTGGFSMTNTDGSNVVGSVTHYDLDSYKTYAYHATNNPYGDNIGSNDNAHNYYNAVTGKTLRDWTEGDAGNGSARTTDNLTTTSLPVVASDTEATTWTVSVPAANATAGLQNYVVLHYEVFLNGWDTMCFDACQGQTITIDMSFAVASGD